MKKKIYPKDQTKELNRARFEFLKRNAEKGQEFIKLTKQNEKKRNIFTTALASYSGNNQKIKEAWDFLLQECLFDKDFKEKLTEIETLPAANTGWHFLNFAMDHGKQVMVHGGNEVFQMTQDVLNQKFLDYLTRNAREIFTELTNGQPSKYLFFGIDLSRSKEAILAEVSKMVTQHQDRSGLGLEEIPKKRFKWLPIADELLEVWDLYEKAGKQPSLFIFRQISRKVGRPFSTVRDQWHQAYEKIYGKPYDPESKYATEEKRTKGEELCAKCPNGAQCYKRIRGQVERIPCADYLRIAGKERSLKTVKYDDSVLYSENYKKKGKKVSED